MNDKKAIITGDEYVKRNATHISFSGERVRNRGCCRMGKTIPIICMRPGAYMGVESGFYKTPHTVFPRMHHMPILGVSFVRSSVWSLNLDSEFQNKDKKMSAKEIQFQFRCNQGVGRSESIPD